MSWVSCVCTQLTDHFFKEDDYVVLSDAACQTPVPADLEYLNMCALAPGELGRVLKDDGTHIRPWQVRLCMCTLRARAHTCSLSHTYDACAWLAEDHGMCVPACGTHDRRMHT